MNPPILLFSSALLLVSTLLLPTAIAQTAQTDPSGTWLDGNTNWNQAGASIPQAPQPEGGDNLPNCAQSVRQATLPEDALVETAGWSLTGAAQTYNGTTVITGMANADGVCRPLDYQVFVFTNGVFSGTLSPILMDSRTDGSVFNVVLYGEGSISASFNRYAPEDALCCASRESSIFYQVENQNGSPVLVPQLPANTVSTSDGE